MQMDQGETGALMKLRNHLDMSVLEAVLNMEVVNILLRKFSMYLLVTFLTWQLY